MNNSQFYRRVILYTIIGFLIGLLIPGIAYTIDFSTGNIPFTFQRFVELHKKTFVYYIFDVVPVFFAIIAFIVSYLYLQKLQDLHQTLDKQYNKTEKIYGFVEKLRKGEIDVEYDADKQDSLGKSLINLRNELKRRDAEEKSRRKEDEQRRWATEGIAQFGEVLREYNDDMQEMAYQVISRLVKYTGAAQGGFFILEEENKLTETGEQSDNEKDSVRYFEQYASYAYDRKKYCDKRIDWGEGLVGACAMEKETIFMTKVTEGYVNITSGLGKANPRCLLIVPLKINEQVFGVIEMATFQGFEKYQIEFVEKLAESIASTISSFKINDRTAQLLKESQEQAQKMRQQEDLLRKNLEELKITQSEAAKQSEEFISFTNSVNHTLIRAEYDIDGTLLYANTKFLQKLGYSSNQEVEGRHISMFINEKDMEWFNKIWSGLAKGGRHFENYMKHVTKDGKDLWTMATYTCVRDPNNPSKVLKILFLAIDTTEQKQQSLDYEGQIKALNRSNLKAEFSPAGSFVNGNDKFKESLGYSYKALKNMTVFDFFDEEEQKQFKNTWTNVINDVPYEGQIRVKTKSNEDRWFQSTFTAVSDMYGDIAKVVFIANDITTQKQMEIKATQQAEQLKSQEEKLQQSEIELSKKLEEAKEEMKRQFKKIEIVKMLHEKTLEGMLDAVVSINRQGYIEFFNKAAEELWGFNRDQVLGEQVEKILPNEYRDKDDNYMGNFFKPGAKEVIGQRTEVFIVNRQKEKVPVLLTISEARMGKEYSLTAFVQNIELELF